jgi:hypothetical protein
MKAQDGVAMLEAKLPEFIKNSVTITPLGKDGEPQFVKDANGNEVPSTAPIVVSEDPVDEKAELLWMFEIGLNNKYYQEQLIPTLIKCFDAITGSRGTESRVSITGQQKDEIRLEGGKLKSSTAEKFNDLGLKMSNKWSEIRGVLKPMTIIKSVSKLGDTCDCISYSKGPKLGVEGYNPNVESTYFCHLRVDLYDSNGDLISSNKQICWQPFLWPATRFTQTGPLAITGPMNDGLAVPRITFSHIVVPVAMLKEIKQVKVSLEAPEIKLLLLKDE